MNGFIKDNNGIWRIPDANYPINYPEKGSQTSEGLENNASFWFNHRNDIISCAISKFTFSGNYADIGGGNGYQILALKRQNASRSYFLIEPGYSGCLTASKRGLDLIYNCGFEEFDFNEAAIHGFGLFDVLEHIPDDVGFLNALYSRMPSNSYLYITVPAHQFLWNDVDDYGQHQRRYDKNSLNKLSAETKFTLVYFSYFFSYLVMPTYLLRTIPSRIFGKRTDEEIIKQEYAQHKSNGIINRIFDLFNSWELNKMRNGDSVACGASCILVLKK